MVRCAVIHNHPIHYKHLLFQELKKAGLSFEVIFAASQSGIRHEDIGLRQDRYRYRFAFEGAYEHAPRSRRAIETWKAMSEIKPDVAIISGYHAAESWAGWIWARLHGCPIIMWYESNEFDYPDRPWWKEILKRVFVRGLSLAHVYGLSNKAYLIKLGLSENQIDIKRAVANVRVFATPPEMKKYSHGKTKQLIYVGRLAPEKNVDILLRAIANATKVAGEALWKLRIVGMGPLGQELRQRCSELGIEGSVEFTGYCPQTELPRLYREADLFVLPSTREPWGLVALEAMLCRVPIAVSTQCGCAIDLVSPETGWVFSPWTAADLTEVLLQLPEMTSSQLATMGNACSNLGSKYSPEACATRIVESIRDLSSRTGRGGHRTHARTAE